MYFWLKVRCDVSRERRSPTTQSVSSPFAIVVLIGLVFVNHTFNGALANNTSTGLSPSRTGSVSNRGSYKIRLSAVVRRERPQKAAAVVHAPRKFHPRETLIYNGTATLILLHASNGRLHRNQMHVVDTPRPSVTQEGYSCAPHFTSSIKKHGREISIV